MRINQFLYESHEQLYGALAQFDSATSCVIQIFTNELLPEESVALARKVKEVCPDAQIIGTSVSGVIYRGEQYDNRTLIVAEQYDRTVVHTAKVSLVGRTCEDIARGIHCHMGEETPALMRLFCGAYYDYAHQLMETMNQLRPGLKIAGGMAGELTSDPKITPFVFDEEGALAEGLVICVLDSQDLKVYSRINTAHETIGEVRTITATRDRFILSIEGERAQDWLQRNFGVLSTREFDTWEEIAQNDPLVRLQLALESHHRAIRFVHYDEATGDITQYFSRLPAGSKFRISYTSPSKCAEESRETCSEIAKTPIEQLFCYSCLFRKLYLKNCAKWELSPYHKNPVNGVFLLGEFGYSDEGNALLNGSCVLSGVAEEERYLTVDMGALDAMDDIRNEDEKLMDFIIRKQGEPSSQEHQKVLEAMVAHESNHRISPYQRIKIGVPIGDMGKYERDKESLRFNKLCMIRVENADVLISQKGHLGYFNHLKYVLENLTANQEELNLIPNVHFYSIKDDTFLIAANPSVDRGVFSKYINFVQKRCDDIQKVKAEMPFLLRFVVARNHPFLLERAYAIMEDCRGSQLHVVTDERFEDGELSPVENSAADELACIQLIQYALEHNGVVPYYQGLYNNETGRVDKYEALMRLRDGSGRIYTPYHFMETSKKYRLYLDLNLNMFRAVLRDFSQLDCAVSVNLSVHDILSPRFRTEMRRALNAFYKPENLTFELLEDECVANMDGIKEFISEVRSYGVKIAVDDFGSGYSNLLEITKIRPDFIKIDGQIISNLGKNEENDSILEAVALLGKRLSIELVAEFVENAAIQERIVAHSIFYSQGYHFSKPAPFEEVLIEATADWGLARRDPEEGRELAVLDSGEMTCENQEERDFFHALQAMTTDLIFRLDLRTCVMRHYGAAVAEMGMPPIIEGFPQSAIEAGLVAPEDIPIMLDTIHNMRQGLEVPGYFRIFDGEDTPNWYQMNYKLVTDARGVPIEAIGKMANIQRQKDMEDRINIDPLTGCLRKDAFEMMASDYIRQNAGSNCILLIVDLDNFKAVNDNLGHQFGDRVLRGVGDKLRSLFRGDDFVGRIGGDEFMVMMTGTDDMEVGKRKAQEVLTTLDATYSGAVHTYRVSASLGMATYPRDGTNFQTLYDNADMALFEAKSEGKNGFVVYHNSLSKGTMENTLPFAVAARTLAQHYDPKVVEEAFNLLFETHEFDLSLQTVLELVGHRFGVSRCYVFEKHPTEVDAYQNTYEWCNLGVETERDMLESVPLGLFREFFDQANDDGVLYCNDLSLLKTQEARAIMEAQNIKSFLHVYIPSADGIGYVVGVDACDSARVWTPMELSTILQTSKIIAQFLSYKRATLEMETIAHQQLAVLDSMEYMCYIIDRKTRELIYFNRYTKEHIPEITLGEPCYKSIRGGEMPCSDCPLKRMAREGTTHCRSVLYNASLDLHVLTLSTVQPSFAGRECVTVTAIPVEGIDGLQVNK